MIPCKAARKYARAVGRHLVCPASRRARLKQLIQHSVDAYLDEKPEAGFPDLVRDIGTPKLFAESLLTGASPPTRWMQPGGSAKSFPHRDCSVDGYCLHCIRPVSTLLLEISGCYARGFYR